jgi:hypothetical protein
MMAQRPGEKRGRKQSTKEVGQAVLGREQVRSFYTGRPPARARLGSEDRVKTAAELLLNFPWASTTQAAALQRNAAAKVFF